MDMRFKMTHIGMLSEMHFKMTNMVFYKILLNREKYLEEPKRIIFTQNEHLLLRGTHAACIKELTNSSGEKSPTPCYFAGSEELTPNRGRRNPGWNSPNSKRFNIGDISLFILVIPSAGFSEPGNQ